MAASVRVEGLSQLRRRLKQLELDTADLKDAHAAVASTVATAAAGRAKRRTGRMAASVRGNRAVGKATVSVGGAALPYVPVIYYGWPARGIEGDPFVVDAAQDTEPIWLPMYEQALADAVDRVT